MAEFLVSVVVTFSILIAIEQRILTQCFTSTVIAISRLYKPYRMSVSNNVVFSAKQPVFDMGGECLAIVQADQPPSHRNSLITHHHLCAYAHGKNVFRWKCFLLLQWRLWKPEQAVLDPLPSICTAQLRLLCRMSLSAISKAVERGTCLLL